MQKRIFVVILLLMVARMVNAQQIATAGVSGDYYNWKTTMQPERPWMRDYSQTLVMKMFLCSRDGNGDIKKVYLTFDSALQVIKRLNNLTLGIPKIVYLVGWQFTGHDSGYPSWAEVNNALKRKQDATALESLHWLIRQAKQYHTTVSLHINMTDAFKSSPLWAEYDKNNIILKDKSGNPIPGEVFDGMQSYQISYAQEWKTGLAQKRINNLLAMLPELKQGGTIHIDAFHSIQPTRKNDTLSSPLLGLTVSEEIAAQRKIFRYWRDMGLDVTSEGDIYWLRRDPFIGLQPMAWHFDISDFRNSGWIGKPAGFDSLPPSLYCGTVMPAEQQVKDDPINLAGLVEQFCTNVVPWYYVNNIKKNAIDSPWQIGDDVFMPALWLPQTIVAYSEKGYTEKKWQLPAEWKNASSVTVSDITVHGLTNRHVVPVHKGVILLTLQAGEGAVIAAERQRRY